MLLRVIIDDQVYELNVPGQLIEQAGAFFDKMDADMDAGWQMGQDWIDAPDLVQRCQIVADKLVTALEKENHKLGRMMAGYILSRLPDVDVIEPDLSGEPGNTEIRLRDGAAPATGVVPSAVQPPPEVVAEAERRIGQVFKQGRQWRYTVLDPNTGNWEPSPAIGSEQEAERLRRQAVRKLALDLVTRH